MFELAESQRDRLAELCRGFGVVRLELFGSLARGEFDDAKSDIDLLVEFRDPGAAGYADRYLEFAESLEKLFGHRVDLVTTRSLRNPIFIQSISMERKTLYAA